MMWLLLGVAGSGPRPARAEGIPMGHAQFFPSVIVESGRNSNIFSQSEEYGNVVPDIYSYIRVPLLWRLPFRQSRWDLSYAPGWNNYKENDELDGPVHDLDTEVELNFSSGAQLSIRGGVLLDYLNTQAFGAGEVVYSDQRYTFTEAYVEFEHPFNLGHGMRAQVAYQDLNFNESGRNSFVDYTLRDLDLSYLKFLGPGTTLAFALTMSRNDQERLVLETEEGKWSRDGFQVGLEHNFDERDLAQFYVGYDVLSFDRSDDADYAGVVGRFIYQRALTPVVYIQAELVRDPYQSVFNVNNYYLTDRVAVNLLFRPPGRMFFVLAAAFQRNGYPDITQEFCRSDAGTVPEPIPPGETCPDGSVPATGLGEESIGIRRQDYLLRWTAGLGVQFNRTSALEFRYQQLSRTSNTPEVEFDTGVVSLEFRFGWSGQGENI